MDDHQRIVWVSHFPIFGGPHNLALRLAEPLAVRGVETLFVLPDEPGSAAERLRDGGVEVQQIELQRLRARLDPRLQWRTIAGFQGDVARLARLLEAHRSDAVLLTGLANPHAAFAARRAGVPVIWQIADSRTPPPVRIAEMALVRRLADAVMFNGQALAESHLRGRPLSQQSFQFAGVVDADRFRADARRRAETRRRLGIPEDAFLVGTVANLNPQKGIEYFIRAAALIHASRPDSWFLIAGAGYGTHRDYRQLLDREMQMAGLAAGRFIVTEAQRPEEIYAALDVKLITSVPRSEGTTNTAIEAMACGVPVVATDVGAIAEVVEDGVTGLVVPPLSPEAIAAATALIGSDEAFRSSVAAAGREKAVRLYSAAVSSEVYVQALAAAKRRQQVISGRADGRG